ncbi:hypothetical protein FQA39_LY02457 [Lamprigera yunnana]|nr:hypothetical protein FQA39_LY02457 [Lamprigera yunnana]
MSDIILGLRILPNQYQRIKLNNINLAGKVNTLKYEAAKKLNVLKENIELIYCGLVLEDDSTLSSYGVEPGVTIHVLEKKLRTSTTPIKKLTETDFQQAVQAIKKVISDGSCRSALHKLSRHEALDNIISTTPGLVDDPVAVAIIRDPELIFNMIEENSISRAAEHHPSLLEALHRIAAFVREESSNTNHNQAGTSSGYSYSLEVLSDDDDDMESLNDSPQEAIPLTRNSSYNAITAAQLASAIANATNATFGLSNSPSYEITPSGGDNSNIITSEMFSNAMQQAFASSQSTSANTASCPITPSASVPESIDTIPLRLQPQLQQMQEMGLLNETTNMRALQTTSGDIQAAIELVLSGAFD